MKSVPKKIVFLGMFSTLLVGCTTPEDELARYRQVCLNYGFEYGSDAFAKCILEQERMDRKDQRRQENLRQKRPLEASSSYSYDTLPTYGSTLSRASHSYREDALFHRRQKLNDTMVAQREARSREQARRAEQIRKDEELARKLQAEEYKKAEQIRKDEELARKLQAEENAKAGIR
ncbi:MAG: hypothetical protein K0M45_01955 [Candidatus Paracaedibacteraceae bacterium]|nr:hypothetical protein [Candidatus Paracaedibacteraceae bacterium]